MAWSFVRQTSMNFVRNKVLLDTRLLLGRLNKMVWQNESTVHFLKGLGVCSLMLAYGNVGIFGPRLFQWPVTLSIDLLIPRLTSKFQKKYGHVTLLTIQF